MRKDLRPHCVALYLCLISVSTAQADGEGVFRSHPPMRTLPKAAKRPLDKAPHYFVDAKRGDDGNNGSLQAPWKTLRHAVSQLKPGDTLCLRGGTYYETLTVDLRGTAEMPITIRSYPRELAVIDGGWREFFEQPAAAWEPSAGGATDEYRSTKTYGPAAREARRGRRSPIFAASKKHYPDGWAVRDLFADPKLTKIAGAWSAAADVRLRPDSPAIDAGIGLPSDWPDPLRGADKGRPDIGLLPLAAEMFGVGPTAASR